MRATDAEPASGRRAASIRGRLLRWLLPLLLAIELVSSLIAYRGALVPVEAAFDQALVDAALAVSAHLQTVDGRLRLDLSEQSIAVLRADSRDQVFFRVIDPRGVTLAGDADLDGPSARGGRGILERPRRDGPMYRFFDSTFEDEPIRGVSFPVVTTDGTATVLVAETIRKRVDARNELIVSRVVEDLGVFAVLLAAVWLAVGAVLRPVERLAQQVRERSANDLQPLSGENAPSEVVPLVQSLNRLFGKIVATQAGQRRFIENAAHQLRTPLAGLKGQVDLAIAEARAQRPQTDRDAPSRLVAVGEATSRVIHLTNQLLTLARSDRPTHDAASRQVVRLPELVDSVIAAQLDAALEREQDLGAETAPAMLRAVEWELREMLANLVDNAIRYTPAGGNITVRCGVDSTHAPWLEVQDTGPGIPEPERERVFERFYRIPSAPPGGSGLGLAIVHEIARLHDARVDIRGAGASGGTLIRVTFPALDQSAAATPLSVATTAVPGRGDSARRTS